MPRLTATPDRDRVIEAVLNYSENRNPLDTLADLGTVQAVASDMGAALPEVGRESDPFEVAAQWCESAEVWRGKDADRLLWQIHFAATVVMARRGFWF